MAYSYGWRQDLEDHAWIDANQLHFDAHKFRAVKVPASIDPRPHIHIKDQQQLGACSGFSRSTCEEVLNWIATQGDKTVLSAMYAYLTNQKCCGCFGKDNGATIAGSIQAAAQYGICLDSTFPYTGKYSTKFPANAQTEGQKHLVKSHTTLSSYNDGFQYLATGTGVIQIGVPVGDAFQNCSGTFTVQDAQQDMSNPEGGHALAIVGYVSQKDSQGRNYLILVNSWGTSWGSNGTCLIDPAAFDLWASTNDGSCEVAGLSDLEAYGDGGDGRLDWNNIYV
jgi:C1A family cysteine protease